MPRRARIAILPDRTAVTVKGEEASAFLQGLLTNDLSQLAPDRAVHAGLLSPQGKILFDVIATRTADGLALDVARDKAAELAKRLMLYKLRAKVEIADRSADLGIVAVWEPTPDLQLMNAEYTADPRLSALGYRGLYRLGTEDALLRTPGAEPAAAEAYHAHRIALGVPEGGKDYPFGDTYPHEALFDQFHGVSFSKGCYVGQEVVSRMQHRATVKKRVTPVAAGAPLVPGTPVKAGDVEIGTIGSVSGSRALALLRLDRAEEFQEKGVPLLAGGTMVTIETGRTRYAMASHP